METRNRHIDGPIARPTDAAALGTVLGVWAHPDDEAYLSAGLMALACDAGNHVTCLTATLGEHGTSDPATWPPDRLAHTRRLEIRACMAVLGVTDHRVLGYEDGTLADQDAASGIARIARVIDEVAPDTIVTFGPDGMTGHPDHRTISRWTTAAWEQSGGASRLLYATTTDTFADEFADVHDEIPVFGPGLPLRTPSSDIALTVVLGGTLLDRKLAALRAQATQVQPLVEQIGEGRYRRWWRTETFRSSPQYISYPVKGGGVEADTDHRAGRLSSGARRRGRARGGVAATPGRRPGQAAGPLAPSSPPP